MRVFELQELKLPHRGGVTKFWAQAHRPQTDWNQKFGDKILETSPCNLTPANQKKVQELQHSPQMLP